MKPTAIKGRYAPSPTGFLHLGNVRTALLAWLQMRLLGGRFILRIEDLDPARSRPEHTRQIIDDLYWLGLDWDEGPDTGGPHSPYLQSQRLEYYEQAFERLRTFGLLYPCYCSRKDIAQAASAPHGRQPDSVYPGSCRGRDSNTPIPPGLQAAWRYRVGNLDIEVVDEIMGNLVQNLEKDVGDFVVRRADAAFAYQLAVVVDDAQMGITDVVRGADLFDSTPRQLDLIRALGLVAPRYWHVPLMNDAQGRRLAKRHGDGGLAALRAQRIQPQQVVGQLAHGLGLIPRLEALSAQELLAGLDSAWQLASRLRALVQSNMP